MVAFFSPALPYVVPTTMIDVLKHLGMESGLKLCLDAGDVNSVASGTQDKWLDTSGNGYDFFRGTGTGSDAADPTFNGVVGRQSSSEYWGYDGGDWFTYDTTNETWMENIHKDGAKFAFAFWFYMTAYAAGQSPYLAADNQANTFRTGFNINVRESPVVRFGVTNGSGTAVMNIDSTATVPTNQWTFIGMTMDEAASSATLQINSTQEAKSASYTSPSASAATHTMAISANGSGDGDSAPANGSRMASVTMWEGTVPTAAQLLALYNSTKAKFGH